MNTGNSYTNDDCEKCYLSSYQRTAESDFEEYIWKCPHGDIAGLFSPEKKPCGLEYGFYYEGTVKLRIKSPESNKRGEKR